MRSLAQRLTRVSARLSRRTALSASAAALRQQQGAGSAALSTAAGAAAGATAEPKPKRPAVMVWGGSGALGQAMIAKFKGAGWHTLCVDYAANPTADDNVVIDADATLQESADGVKVALRKGDNKFGCMVNAAGGWTGERPIDAKFLASAERMLASNVGSCFATVHLAAEFLSEGGVCVLTGSAACVEPTPAFVSYGAAKAAVHHLVRSVAAAKPPHLLLPNGACIACIAPLRIDTPQNRKAMPKADFSTFTLPSVFASRVLEWADRRQPPVNGGLYVFETKDGTTDIRLEGALSTAPTTAIVDG